jgi:hypothetical protein
MTTEEYAALVRRTVKDAADARAFYADDHQLADAYRSLGEDSAKRCLGVGKTLYEVDAGTQLFEQRDVSQAIIECRQEALDVPAYLTQIGWHFDVDADPDIREGIDLAARMLVVLDRISARVKSDA